MTSTQPPMIVGAGPVGLAAALFLARAGRHVRIVEERAEPSTHSKALAINPRTLDLLEPTGITARMLEIGTPIWGVHLHRGAKRIAAVSLAGIHPRYPHMLALSQATTERLLEEALEREGGRVERGTKLVDCRNAGAHVELTLEHAQGERSHAQAPWMLAADGAHSTARHALAVDFPGATFPDQWHLADAPLRTNHDPHLAHVFFLPRGEFLFLLRVVDPAYERVGVVWRVMGNRPDPLSRLVGAEASGQPVWESSFHVAHRLASNMTRGGVFLAGDAAHIHSPVGARGMNLGIEDAWVFATLAEADRLGEYERLRRPVDAGVVRSVELVSKIASGESAMFRVIRRFVLPLAIRLAFVRRRALATVAGLDHPLPRISA
ncbi:MAG: FAD-dependent monooxygenase [Phycisphaerales bacterium]